MAGGELNRGPRTTVNSDFVAAMFGLVGGLRPEHVAGSNQEVGAGFESIWLQGGLYNFVSSADTIRVAAGGDAADQFPAGAGARNVRVEGLDINGEEIFTVLNTNGIAAGASSVEEFFRVNRVYVPDGAVGTYNTSNAGDIVIEQTGGGGPVAKILATRGTSQNAIYTIPATHEGVLTHAFLSTDGNAINAILCHRNTATTTNPASPVMTITDWPGINTINETYQCGVQLPPLSDVFFSCQRVSGGLDAAVSGSFDLWLREI